MDPSDYRSDGGSKEGASPDLTTNSLLQYEPSTTTPITTTVLARPVRSHWNHSSPSTMASLKEEYLSNLTESQKTLLQKLNSDELGQSHLFEGWGSLSSADRKAVAEQIEALDKAYNNGGLAGYIGNARKLLANSKNGVNPLDGWEPNVPEGATFELGTDKYKSTEEKGLEELGSIGFVLVAGRKIIFLCVHSKLVNASKF